MTQDRDKSPPVELINPDGRSPVLLVCEHASNHIPAEYDGLGLAGQARTSHAAWDPGALGVAKCMARLLDARLVAGTVSRLVYDCNRPPDSPGAMPSRSELIDVPGNAGLTDAQKAARVQSVYEPFRAVLAGEISRAKTTPVLVTVHSFTPVYMNKRREVEIGILHDSDSRLADGMLDAARGHEGHIVLRNEPYGPEDGVTHTLKLHGIENGIANVMLEIANNLIDSTSEQETMGVLLTGWLRRAMDTLGTEQVMDPPRCRA